MSTTLLDVLPDLEMQLDEAEREAAAAQERAVNLRQIIEGIHGLNGRAASVTFTGTSPAVALNAADSPPEGKPRGRLAVRMIVRERPGIWPLSDLVAALEARDWLTNRKAAEVAVHRMTNAGEARRLRAGVYEFPAPATNGTAEASR